MTLKEMRKGIPFSPVASLTQPVNEADSIIYVDNLNAFPDAPNLATIGVDEFAETVRYAAIAENALSGCMRGVEGEARQWEKGAPIGRNFSAMDYDTIIDNVLALNQGKAESSHLHDGRYIRTVNGAGPDSNGNIAVNKAGVGLSNVANERQYSANNPPPYPVTKVAGKAGEVALVKADVGLGNVDNIRQYSANNPPPYPVTSVAGRTGAVSLTKSDVGLSNVANERQYSANNPPPYPVTKSTLYTSTLSVSNWSSSNTYTISVSGVTSASAVEVVPGLNITEDQLKAYQTANIQDGGQAANSITLKAYGKKPAVDIPIRIILRRDL